MSLCRIASVIG